MSASIVNEIDFIIRELDVSGYNKYKSELSSLLFDVYNMNFDISHEMATTLSNQKIEDLEKYIKDEDAALFGCIQEHKLVAFAWLYAHDYFGTKRIHLNHIAVDKNYRKVGIAKKMLNHIEAKARVLGVQFIDLYVSESNNAAVNLYERNEFVTERRYMSKKINY